MNAPPEDLLKQIIGPAFSQRQRNIRQIFKATIPGIPRRINWAYCNWKGLWIYNPEMAQYDLVGDFDIEKINKLIRFVGYLLQHEKMHFFDAEKMLDLLYWYLQEKIDEAP